MVTDISFSYSVGDSIVSGGDSGQLLSGKAGPWLHLLPCQNGGLVLPDFLIYRRKLRCADFFDVKVSDF